MNLSAVLARYRQWRDGGTPMVLAIVVKADGSTYAKPGGMMLIGQGGQYEGLLSGGCLEGDLMSRAEPVFMSGNSTDVIYDMRDQEHDQLWGLGLGCGGMMQIQLMLLDPAAEYFPLGAIEAAVSKRQSLHIAMLMLGGRSAGLCQTPESTNSYGLNDEQRRTLEPLLVGCERPEVVTTQMGDAFVAPITLPTRLLILGAGPDALPLAQQALLQGWELQVVDHRPAYADPFRAAGGPEISVMQPAPLASHFDLDGFDAAVVMRHHLATDHVYLRNLANTTIPYIGSLGPRDRRDQLLKDLQPELGNNLANLKRRLYAPIGLDIGARGPEGIALAICAQIQSALSGHHGGHLGSPTTA
jgi:xanthine dehydrogenase accessory factor